MSVEIIEFFRPEAGRKNLFISNIAGNVTEDVVHETLHGDFSQFGLIYEVQVFPLNSSEKSDVSDGTRGWQSETNPHAMVSKTEQTPLGWYAFVKFYSCMAACKAKVFLDGQLSMGQPYKISFAARRTLQDDKPPVLYFRKCQQLANYYLGFNGWSVAIKRLEDDSSKDNAPIKVRYVCSVRLTLTNQGLQSDGVGVWEEDGQENNPDFMSKGALIGRVKKLAYQVAVQNAFSKVVLIVLSNGKVNVEINTTKVDTLLKKAYIDESGLIKVNELEKKPGETEQEETAQVRADAEFPQLTDSILDDANVHLLQELEDM